jgi:hypothetical protein
MSDAEDRNAPIGFLGKDSAGTSLALGIKPGGGFVQNEDCRGASESLSEQHPLALASRKG